MNNKNTSMISPLYVALFLFMTLSTMQMVASFNDQVIKNSIARLRFLNIAHMRRLSITRLERSGLSSQQKELIKGMCPLWLFNQYKNSTFKSYNKNPEMLRFLDQWLILHSKDPILCNKKLNKKRHCAIEMIVAPGKIKRAEDIDMFCRVRMAYYHEQYVKNYGLLLQPIRGELSVLTCQAIDEMTGQCMQSARPAPGSDPILVNGYKRYCDCLAARKELEIELGMDNEREIDKQ